MLRCEAYDWAYDSQVEHACAYRILWLVLLPVCESDHAKYGLLRQCSPLPAVKASGWIVPSNKNVAFGHGERTTRQSGCSDRAAGTDSVRRRCKGIPSTGRRSLHLFAVNEKMAFLRHIYTLPRRS